MPTMTLLGTTHTTEVTSSPLAHVVAPRRHTFLLSGGGGLASPFSVRLPWLALGSPHVLSGYWRQLVALCDEDPRTAPRRAAPLFFGNMIGGSFGVCLGRAVSLGGRELPPGDFWGSPFSDVSERVIMVHESGKSLSHARSASTLATLVIAE